MVSITWSLIALLAGLLIYLAIPFTVGSSPIHVRQRVGRVYGKLAARCLKQWAFIRRVLSGYDIMQISVDDSQKLLKVTLSSSLIGSDNEYEFKDPDNRILRLYGKPVAIAYEEIPAAIDAELAEIGHWLREKDTEEGLVNSDSDNPLDVTVDPYVPVKDHLRLVDPIDAYELVINSVSPENIKTARQITKRRYEKYGRDIGVAETLGAIFGFLAGIGGVSLYEYVQANIIGDGGGSSVPTIDLPMSVLTMDPSLLMDGLGALL